MKMTITELKIKIMKDLKIDDCFELTKLDFGIGIKFDPNLSDDIKFQIQSIVLLQKRIPFKRWPF